MNPEEAECWIVNLIRNARLDAKIDSKLAHVVMGTQPLSPYQQLVEKIDSLSVRSEALQRIRFHKAILIEYYILRGMRISGSVACPASSTSTLTTPTIQVRNFKPHHSISKVQMLDKL
uniref:PCI domain-containing protein n=1 Tax=Timema genevievae TaxID=629358 RepID=A0A7R9JSF3_TIMGE|nr:unnamed protein product [Timema genevievae]